MVKAYVWHPMSEEVRRGKRQMHFLQAATSFAIPILLVVALLGCRPETDAPDVRDNGHIVVTDDTGYAAEFRETPARVVSVAPNLTEIMFAIGADDRLVGVTEQCDFPPEAKLKPRIGDFVAPSLEKIFVREPDLVIGCGSLHPVLARIRDLGVPVLSFNPATIDELLIVIEKIGAVLGRQEAASALTSSLKEEVRAVRSRVAEMDKKARVRVFVEIWHDPLLTAGRGSFVHDLVESAGGVNVAASVGNHYFEISQEHVLDSDPQVIIAVYMEQNVSARNMILNRETWRTVSAVASGKVYDDIDPDLLLRPSVRAVHTVRELAEKFYPELFREQRQ